MEEKIILIFHRGDTGEAFDIEVPVQMTANEFVLAVNSGLSLGIDTKDISKCCLKATNPIALLRGNRTLGQYGLRNGTDIWFDERER